MITIKPIHVTNPAVRIRVDDIKIKISPDARSSEDKYAEVLYSFFDLNGNILLSSSIWLTEDECASWGVDDNAFIDFILTKLNIEKDV